MSGLGVRPDFALARSDAIAFHDHLAADWDKRYRRGGFKRRADFFKSQILPYLTTRGDWLDVGCGTGFFSRLLAERGAVVTGMDGSAAMVAAARVLSRKRDGQRDGLPRFEVRTIESLAGQTKAFDGVICLNVIEYVDAPEARFAELASLLGPGATLVVSAPNTHAFVRRLQIVIRSGLKRFGLDAFAYLDTSRHTWTRRELAALASRCGLTNIAMLGFDPLVPEFTQRFVPPSLLYLVCQKPVSGPS